MKIEQFSSFCRSSVGDCSSIKSAKMSARNPAFWQSMYALNMICFRLLASFESKWTKWLLFLFKTIMGMLFPSYLPFKTVMGMLFPGYLPFKIIMGMLFPGYLPFETIMGMLFPSYLPFKTIMGMLFPGYLPIRLACL